MMGSRTSRNVVFRNERGNMLLVVTVIALVASSIALTFLSRVEKSASYMTDKLKRRQTFYVADGMSRIVIGEIQDYLLENPDPTTSDLQDPVNIPLPDVEGYDVEHMVIESAGDAYYGLVPNGPFEGMNAHQKPVTMDIVAKKADGEYRSDVHLNVLLGQVSLFQFFVFGAGYTDIFPGQDMTINPGRVHANGDLCLGSTAKFRLERVTAAERVLASDARCRRSAGSGADIWNGSQYVAMDSDTSSECTNCDGSGLDWRAFATTTWHGHVKDRSHGVPYLRLPVAGSPDTQAGLNARQEVISNADTTRILIDPMRSQDTSDIRNQKFAWKADIRIINGVWYKNDGTWPGMPIWSDHPGSFTTRNEEGVEGEAPIKTGQRDLETRFGWGQVPSRFSFYEYDEESGRLSRDDQGILSYGTLIASDGRWIPGFWARGAKKDMYTDVDGFSREYFCNYCNDREKCTDPLDLRPADEVMCQSLEDGVFGELLDTQYLQGTRSGMMDYRVRNSDPAHGPILPVNFDLEAFAAAMSDTTEGELGSYFDGGASFNGIIYITYTWDGAMDGFPGQLPALWPAQGGEIDPSQTPSWDAPMVQQALPYPLCSDDLGYVPGQVRVGFSGPPSDGNPDNGFEPVFTIPSCSPNNSITSRPNAIRFINGARIDTTRFPQGLSLVTNLPAYVLGEFNTGSDTGSASAIPWLPVMVGADALTLLSSAWDDKDAPWSDSSNGFGSRNATNTTFNLEVLAGTVETADAEHYGGGVENFPRFLENWSGRTATIVGAFVVGYASGYQRQPWEYGSPIYNAPKREWSFDPHLSSLSHQPPGSPLFNIHSVTRVSRPALAE